MNFVSLPFAVLLLVVVPAYYLLPNKFRWIVLLAASCVFYAYFNFYLLFLLLFTVCSSYAAALLIFRTKSKKVKNVWLIAGLILNLSVLVVFKYFNFFIESAISLINLFGGEAEPFILNLILPVGISFYTFQTIAYMVDVRNGIIQPEKHFGYYSLFVCFFPQLVAGPIEKAQVLLPQLKRENKFDLKNLKNGFALMAVGFLKKVAVADILSAAVDSVYNSPDLGGLCGLSVLVAAALFFIQIYCDFSGYSDIAAGCALLLGIRLMNNFNKPFQAQSITEFWKRWHISLTEWFNQYIYMPLMYKSIGKKHMLLRSCLYVMFVMFLCGFWHGANWTYVIWGVWLGIYQVVEIILKKPVNKFYGKRNIDRNATWRCTLRKIRTFILVLFPLIFFRANSVGDAAILMRSLFCNWKISADWFSAFITQTNMSVEYALTAIICIIVLKFADDLISVPRGENLLGKENSVLWSAQFVYVAWFVIIAWIFVSANSQINPFIYFQF